MCIGEFSLSRQGVRRSVNYPRDWVHECKSGNVCAVRRTNPIKKIGQHREVLREALTALVIA